MIARKNRRESKVSCPDCNSFKVEVASANMKLPSHIIFDPFFIRGGPLIVPDPSDEKVYSGNIFEVME